MELPSPTDIEFQLALLNAISQCADCTAVAEEVRPVVEKALSLNVADDQEIKWKTRISHALIAMRDKQCWLVSPNYKPATKESKSVNRKWLEANRPSVDAKQQIWALTELGRLEILQGPSIDQQVPSTKGKLTGPHSMIAVPMPKKVKGKLLYEEAGVRMHAYYKEHKTELPKSINDQREFIIGLLIYGCSEEEAFSRALEKMT